MFEILGRKYLRQKPEIKIDPQSPDVFARSIVDHMLKDMKTVSHELADLAGMSIASQVLTKPRLTARILVFFHPFQLGPKFPLNSLYSNAWIDDPTQIVSIAQATLLEFVHETQIHQFDPVSFINHTHAFVDRIAQMDENERESAEPRQGPITNSLTYVLKQYVSTKGDFDMRQELPNATYLLPNGQLVTFPQLLEPVFALTPIRDRVIGLLANDLQRAGDIFLGMRC